MLGGMKKPQHPKINDKIYKLNELLDITMEKINPNDFFGPRAYFTDFDYKIVKHKYNREIYRRDIERKLKILFLTKNTVVCAASHMTHKFTFNLFKDNPILLDNEMIIPALRVDKDHPVDYLNGMRLEKSLKENMAAFYKDNVKKAVSWELIDNSSWFKENLIKALNDEKSVIRRNLTNVPPKKISLLIDEINSQQFLSREFIIKNISNWPRNEKIIFRNFNNLVYHMSGASVTNCESALPQENYIDYSLADISNHKTILSESQIFWKIFLELAFETLLKNNVPIELLDSLNFEDIYYLRKPIEESSFRKSYDELIQKSIQVIEKKNPDDILYDVEEILNIKENVSTGFKDIFELEIPELLKAKHINHARELRKNCFSVGTGLTGFIPFLSNIANLLGLASSGPELFTNSHKTFRSFQEIKNYNLYVKNKERTLHEMIRKSSIADKSELLDVVDLLVETINSKMKL